MEKSIRNSQVVLPLVIAVGSIILLFVLLSSWGESCHAKHAAVENGRLDLAGWDFGVDGNLKLDGNWEFYWDQIIMPEEFTDSSPLMTGTYPVPLYWTKYSGLNLPSKGDATYRLIINTASEYERLAISTPELYTEYALFINGRMLDGNGKLGGTSFRFLDPDVLNFVPGGDRIEIVLQIHNHSHVNAGIGQSFVMGTPKHIYRKDIAETAVDLIFAGICLFEGTYHFVLYLYRKKDYTLLCFTVFCAAVAVRGLISNVTYIMDFFPDLPFVTGSRIVSATIPVITGSMLLYVYYMFQEYVSKRLVQLLVFTSAIYLIFIAFADPFLYSSAFFPYLIVSMLVCAVGLYVALRAIGDKTVEAALYLLGAFFIVASAVNDTLVFIQRLDTGYRLGAGLAAFAVIQSFIMAMQYTRCTNERKQLYEKLHETDMAFMQAQIKPHFIYNALSAISYMCSTDPQKAKKLLMDFSDYLRGCFDFGNTLGLTTLAKEMDIVNAYLSIEKVRFQERLGVECEIDENPQVLIPMLCIQPVVENAVRHGIMPQAEGGIVKIKVWNEKGDTHIRVEDNGVGIPEMAIKEIFSGKTSFSGLANINGRLRLKFGAEINISSRINEGTTVEIIVPRRSQTA